MDQERVERRRGHRSPLQAPLYLRRPGADPAEPSREQMTGNISLGGVYFETDEPEAYAVHDVLFASVSIPVSQRREFPFSRVTGQSRVVRVRKVSRVHAGVASRTGVALAFGEDVTVLSTL